MNGRDAMGLCDGAADGGIHSSLAAVVRCHRGARLTHYDACRTRKGRLDFNSQGCLAFPWRCAASRSMLHISEVLNNGNSYILNECAPQRHICI